MSLCTVCVGLCTVIWTRVITSEHAVVAAMGRGVVITVVVVVVRSSCMVTGELETFVKEVGIVVTERY